MSKLKAVIFNPVAMTLAGVGLGLGVGLFAASLAVVWLASCRVLPDITGGSM